MESYEQERTVKCPCCEGKGVVRDMRPGKRMALMRLVKDIKSKDAAKAIGVTRSALNNMENGRSGFAKRDLEALRIFLGGGMFLPTNEDAEEDRRKMKPDILAEKPTQRQATQQVIHRLKLAERFLASPGAILTASTGLSLIAAARAELQRCWGAPVTPMPRLKRFGRPVSRGGDQA